MSSTLSAPPEGAVSPLPAVPLTVEGASVLHQMMKVKWASWKTLAAAQQSEILEEAAGVLAAMEKNPSGQSALFSQLGHKGDLILIHFRPLL